MPACADLVAEEEVVVVAVALLRSRRRRRRRGTSATFVDLDVVRALGDVLLPVEVDADVERRASACFFAMSASATWRERRWPEAMWIDLRRAVDAGDERIGDGVRAGRRRTSCRFTVKFDDVKSTSVFGVSGIAESGMAEVESS